MNIVQRCILSGAVVVIAVTCIIHPPQLVERSGTTVTYRTDTEASASRALGIALASVLSCISARGYPRRERGPLEGIL